MRSVVRVIGVIGSLLLCISTVTWAQGDRIRKIVLDAGHGGNDPGNLGTNRYKETEKHVALDVTLQLGKYIEDAFPNIEVIYTRTTDVFVELKERSRIANEAQADLFLSIHCNSAGSPQAHGTESFVLGTGKDNSRNLEVMRTVQQENAVVELEEGYEQKYGNFDPNTPEGVIARSLIQNDYLDQSVNLSTKIQQQFKDRVGRRSRGVKQENFHIIRETAMPSVLVELGFLTNANEEDFLLSKKGQVYMASAIFRAFRDYKEEVEQNVGEEPTGAVQPITSPGSPANAATSSTNSTVNTAGTATTPAKPASTSASQPTATAEENVSSSNASSSNAGKIETKVSDLLFKVQIISTNKEIPLSPEHFNGLNTISTYKEYGLIKYLYGESTTYANAIQDWKKAKEVGYDDAFIVAFKHGKRIPLKDAKQTQ